MPQNVIVLFVDDDPNIQRMVEIFLRREDNIQLTFATNGRSALKHLESKKFDIIFTDIQMPEMDGISLIREIKKIDGTVPIVIISAFGQDPMTQKAIETGASTNLNKPFESKSLINIIHELSRSA